MNAINSTFILASLARRCEAQIAQINYQPIRLNEPAFFREHNCNLEHVRRIGVDCSVTGRMLREDCANMES